MYNFLAPDSILRSPNHTYNIRSVLGSGGFGITYRATMQITSGTGMPVMAVVAIKEHFLSNDCERDSTTQSVSYSQPARDRVERSRRDFAGEAKRLQTIASGHANIVQVSEVFDANNTSYYVMEYLEGESLADYVKRHGPLSEQETVGIMHPIIDAVSFLHRNRITHLDIKPANIMLSKDAEGKARPVLIDFGLSKHYNADGSATSTINLQGYSDGYAPVEQYVGISTFSPASDVYSLAATILFCLTGKTPPKSIELTHDAFLRIIPSTTSQRLVIMLEQCLSMSAADRPANASVILSALPHYMNGHYDQKQEDATTTSTQKAQQMSGKTTMVAPHTVSARPIEPAPAPTTFFPDKDDETEENPRRRTWLWFLIAALVLLGSGIAYYSINSGSQTDDTSGVIEFPSSYTFTGQNMDYQITHRLIFVSPQNVIWAMDVNGIPCPVGFGIYSETDHKILFSSSEGRNRNISLFRTCGDISFQLTPDASNLDVTCDGIDENYMSSLGLANGDNIVNTFIKDGTSIVPQSTLSGFYMSGNDENSNTTLRFESPTCLYIDGSKEKHGYILYNDMIGITSGDNLTDEFLTGIYNGSEISLKRSSVMNKDSWPEFTISQHAQPSSDEMPKDELLELSEDIIEETPRSMDEIQQSGMNAGTSVQEGMDDIIDHTVMTTEVKVEAAPAKSSKNDNEVFTSVEQMPDFPGGQAALLQWVSQHLQYPPVAAENGIQGRVTVQFVVTKTGSIGQVKVVRGKDPDLDREAIRVVKSLPKFTPGKMNGHPVNVWYTLPITFRLQGY